MATKIDGEAEAYILKWKIKNISHCWLYGSQCIHSLSFTVKDLGVTKWRLRLYPKGVNFQNYVEFYLYREIDSGPESVSVSYQLAFLGNDGSFLKETAVVSVKDFKQNYKHGFNENETQENVFVTEREKYLPDDTLTVQFMVWGKGAKPTNLKHLYVGTIYEVARKSFNWRIEKFSTVKSGVINQFRDSFIHFDLVLSEGMDFEKRLALKLSNANKKYFSFKCSVVDSEGKKDFDTHEYFENDLRKEVFSPLLFSKKLFENKSRYLPNDVLSLDCEYVCSNGKTSYEYLYDGKISPTLQTEIAERKEENFSSEDSLKTAELGKDLEFLYNNGIFSDVQIRTSTKTFPAHRIILSARSLVFRNMFSNDMKEKNSGHVDIDDFTDDTIHQMLLYVYTDSLEDLRFDRACKLYKIADKYAILSLKKRCYSFLRENLSPTNACDLLVLSDLHNDDDLKSAVQDYIVMQRKLIFCSQEWKDFMSTNLKLAADVMYKRIYED